MYIGSDLSVSAIAAVLKPSDLSCPIQSSPRYVHGTWNTVPMLTRTARRYSGSLPSAVSRTASMPSAAAERKIAPMFVGFITFSSTAMRRAPRHTSSTEHSLGRSMAHSIPRVK